jgi:DNA uptake protein ComE-like DNA-binding protein
VVEWETRRPQDAIKAVQLTHSHSLYVNLRLIQELDIYMSQPNSTSSSAATSEPSTESLLTLLDTLSKHSNGAEGESDESDIRIQQLIEQLQSADNLAQRLDSRLDRLLDNLGSLLSSLEQENTNSKGAAEKTSARVEAST